MTDQERQVVLDHALLREAHLKTRNNALERELQSINAVLDPVLPDDMAGAAVSTRVDKLVAMYQETANELAASAETQKPDLGVVDGKKGKENKGDK